MMESGLLKRGAEDEQKEMAMKKAEDKFFEILKSQKDERMKLGKPMIFNDD